MNPQVPGGATARGIPSGFDRVLWLVGQLNHGWADTEGRLAGAIARLPGTAPAAAAARRTGPGRMRLDTVERFAGALPVPAADRARILRLALRLRHLSDLRDHYNRCIFAFDPESGNAPDVMGRLAARVRGGRQRPPEASEKAALAAVARTLAELRRLDRDIRAASPGGDPRG